MRVSLRSLWDNPGPDQGWSIVVAASIWIINFIVMSPMRSAAVFYNAMLFSMDLNPEKASWPFSLCNAMSGFSGLLGGYLTERYTCRQVAIGSSILAILSFTICYVLPLNIQLITLSYGLLFGVSHGIFLTITPMVVNDYFESLRTTASGLTLTGVSAVGVIGPILAKYSVERYDIRGSFLILATLVCQMLVPSSLLRPRTYKHFPEHRDFKKVQILSPDKNELKVGLSNNELTLNPIREEKTQWFQKVLNTLLPSSMKTLLQEPVFLLLCLGSSAIHVCYYTFLSFAVTHGISRGFSLDNSTLFVTCYSLGELLSRFSMGLFIDKKICSANFALSVILMLAGICLIVFGWTSNIVVAFASSFCFGFAAGSYVPLRGTIIAEIFGVKRTAFAIGILHTLAGCLFLMIPKLIGLLSKEEGTFEYVCYVLGGISIVGAFIWSLEKMFKRPRTN